MIKKLRLTPTLTVTRYDIISSALLSLMIMLVLGNMLLAIIWLTNRNVAADIPTPAVPVEPLRLQISNNRQRSPALQVVSPDPETGDPSVVDTQSAEAQLQTQVDQLATVATSSVQVAEKIEAKDKATAGQPGSQVADGTKVVKTTRSKNRSQRWFFEFDRQSLTEYAKQLDHFKIEVGTVTPDGKLVYLRDVTKKTPTIRTVRSGKDEKRMYFRGLGSQSAAIKLFANCGIDASQGLTVHFLPKELEAQLAKLELEKNDADAKDILRTYFRIKPTKTGYKFEVKRQLFRR
ncbi:hypothetical protein OAH18_02125 [bacterium]|nr:hypothetical protein [bacterium]